MDTTILLRRSANLATAANVQLQYGEPLYTDDQYLTVGNGNESLVSVRNVLRFVPKAQADSQLYYTINASGKIVLNTSNGSTLTPVITFGDAAVKDVATEAVQGSTDLITSGAVETIKSNIEDSLQTLNDSLETLSEAVSNVAGKGLDDSVTQGSENPVTAGAVYAFVTEAIAQAFGGYLPWTTDSTEHKKFYVDGVNGLQYYNNNQWNTVPVGYT